MKDGQFTDAACYQLFGLGRAVGCSPPRLEALTGARSDIRAASYLNAGFAPCFKHL